MVQRRNRASGEGFLGCSRYPSCRATLAFVPGPDDVVRRAPFRPRVWKGGRRRDLGDDAELMVARLLGRNLGFVGGTVLRLVLIVVILVAAVNLIGPVSQMFASFYVSQIHLGPTLLP
jgi:ssDNA-binding Zn-finger/Zn-ribbon topoisomerase 1